MLKVLILTEPKMEGRPVKLCTELAGQGIAGDFFPDVESLLADLEDTPADAVLLIFNGSDKWVRANLVSSLVQKVKIPLIALLERQHIKTLEPELGVDDFVIQPVDVGELALRIQRAVWHSSSLKTDDLIKSGDLLIDRSQCKVFVSSRPVDLTFREYELLKFLVSHPGRVFSREVLLNEVWGYEYFGGDRTVDVNMRRLRSKLDSNSEAYIETVRNVGYRFRKEKMEDKPAEITLARLEV